MEYNKKVEREALKILLENHKDEFEKIYIKKFEELEKYGGFEKK